jgi:hypothetical protein
MEQVNEDEAAYISIVLFVLAFAWVVMTTKGP